jgi:hypothetical protein
MVIQQNIPSLSHEQGIRIKLFFRPMNVKVLETAGMRQARSTGNAGEFGT